MAIYDREGRTVTGIVTGKSQADTVRSTKRRSFILTIPTLASQYSALVSYLNTRWCSCKTEAEEFTR